MYRCKYEMCGKILGEGDIFLILPGNVQLYDLYNTFMY